ncbi:hypothetical protein AMTR_s00004p00049760 [Amborella trichopoda]|uniref:Uncharacterized protein n=1 Tax=Amborella trichopoda TaxID=13333 RepID=W1NDU4_AMBTC|nr:hypothetical protein AMTR_s00004p00049760 [Amborella trichopoda]
MGLNKLSLIDSRVFSVHLSVTGTLNERSVNLFVVLVEELPFQCFFDRCWTSLWLKEGAASMSNRFSTGPTNCTFSGGDFGVENANPHGSGDQRSWILSPFVDEKSLT